MAEIVEPGGEGWPDLIPDGLVLDDRFWRAAAAGAVRDYCGWHVAPIITERMRLDGRGGRTLLVPSLRILEVVSCFVDGNDVADEVRISERAGYIEFDRWPCGAGSIDLTIRHGFLPEEAPGVLGIVADAAQRAKGPAGIARQQVSGASVTYLSASDLMGAERAKLDRYRLTWGA